MKDYKDKKVKLLAEVVDFIGNGLFMFAKRKKIINEAIKEIIILKFDRIGDTFICLPTIEAIKKGFPQSKITFLCAKWNLEVLRGNPFIDDLIMIDDVPDVHKSSIWSFIKLDKIEKIKRKIKEINPDMVVDLQGNPMNVAAMYLSGMKIRVGFNNKILSFLLTHKAKYNDLWPQAKIYFSLIEVMGLNEKMDKSKMYPSQEESDRVNSLIEKDNLSKFIIFHLGAGRSYRQWSVENFSILGNKILDEWDGKIAVIGSAGEMELYDKFYSKINNKERVYKFFDLNLKELYYLISKADFFVGNESGPGHFAANLGVPMISFMNGWIDTRRWEVQSDKAIIFYKNAHDCKGPNCNIVPCPSMEAIKVEEVFEKLKNKFLYEDTPSQ